MQVDFCTAEKAIADALRPRISLALGVPRLHSDMTVRCDGLPRRFGYVSVARPAFFASEEGPFVCLTPIELSPGRGR